MERPAKPKQGIEATVYEKSKYTLLREKIAELLKVPVDNVDIFTVMNVPTKMVDIRYAAHGSPYYRPARLDGLLNQHKDEVHVHLCTCDSLVFFIVIECELINAADKNDLYVSFSFVLFHQLEASLGIKIVMTPVDLCLEEVCESGGCSNVLRTTMEPLTINTNATSMIGVTSYVEAVCKCAARVFKKEELKCRPDSCANGGTCVKRETDIM